ncbi:MAG: gamma-glutamyltransferase [Bdellovibrionales bacterium]
MKRAILLISILLQTTAHAIPAEGHKLLISGPSPYAVEAGHKIAALGGNVIDVAVAVGLTLSVTTPYYAALGGGGFALVKMDGAVQALDFRETAPAKAGKDYYKNLPKDASITGGHAVGVPGFAAGLYALHQKYGKLKWEKLFSEALALANGGMQVSGEWVRKTDEEKARFNGAGKAAFFEPKQIPYKPGEILKQPELAKALNLLKEKKLQGFYSGPVAEDIVKTVQAEGGDMTLEDLKAYKVRWLTPITTDFEGYKIYLMPPPSSGGVVILSALKLMETLNLKSKAPLSVDELHLLSEIEARAFRGRVMLGDPDFHKNPLKFLTSPAYLNDMAKSVNLKKSVALKPLAATDLKEGTETTHFSVMDNEGHAIALTVTLNGNFGSAVVTNRFHIALNDEMDDFTTRPGEANMYGLVQGLGNDVEPGKRPLSSMSPTLVEKDGKVIMSLGAPGGPRIITAVLQTLYRVLAQNMNVDAAVQAPRVHHQFEPNKLYVDSTRFSPEVLKSLRDRGHVVEEATSMGKAYAIRLRPDGILEGAFDARGEGAAGGI